MDPIYTQSIDIHYFGRFTVYADLFGITNIKVNESVEDKACIYTEQCVAELQDYFDRKINKFSVQLSVPLSTPFQKKVWDKLKEIPFGKTISYLDLANSIDNPKAVRAVGSANGQNPIPILIPCHRVIGNNGKLTGYALGLELKRKLLDFESSQTHLPF